MENNKNIIRLDIVYTYVDSNDKKWLKQKKRDCNINSVYRYNSDLEEIKYSVYSVEKYFKNKFRNIYFVTNNGKLPKCIEKKDNYIPLLYTDLVGYRTYNSTVIEANLHKIDGLSEYYLYFNDDMILMKKLKISDFIDKNTNKLIWYKETSKIFNLATVGPEFISSFLPLFTKADNGTIQARNKIYKMIKIDSNNIGQMGHNPRIFKKSMVEKLCNKFKKELKKNKDRMIRSEDDFTFCDAFLFYNIKKNKIIFTDKYKTKILIQFDNSIISKIYNNTDNIKNYHFLCIEDIRDNNKVDKNIKQILNKKFKISN